MLKRWTEEPFRLFFPLAVVSGVLGVLMWPLHFGGVLPFYPGMNHSRVMAFGFFGGFIMGFLLTALPRLLASKPLRLFELILIAAGYLGVTIAHFFSATVLAELVTVLWLLSFGLVMLPRFLRRGDLPPPGFVLVVLGMLCAIVGAAISVWESRVELDSRWLVARQLLQFQGFLLLPVTGVGGFILPRILGLPERQDFPESTRPSKAWWRQFWMASLVGGAVLVSFWIELTGQLRGAYGIRFASVTAYLASQVPWYRVPAVGSFPWVLRVGLSLLVLGLLLVAGFPAWRVAWLHLSLGIGLVLITLTVASRVVCGHGDCLERMSGRQRWFVWVFGFVVVGLTSRMIGDFLPRIMVTHYVYGAVFFTVAVLYWSVKMLWSKR